MVNLTIDVEIKKELNCPDRRVILKPSRFSVTISHCAIKDAIQTKL